MIGHVVARAKLEKSAQRVTQSERMKAYWAKRKAAAVETGVREEPRSEPAVVLPRYPLMGVESHYRQLLEDGGMVPGGGVMVTCVANESVKCSRCGHGLAEHDYRGCREGACRCGSWR